MIRQTPEGQKIPKVTKYTNIPWSKKFSMCLSYSKSSLTEKYHLYFLQRSFNTWSAYAMKK